MNEVFVDIATVLLTSEQRDWVNRKNFFDRGAAIRALIQEQVQRERETKKFAKHQSESAVNV